MTQEEYESARAFIETHNASPATSSVDAQALRNALLVMTVHNKDLQIDSLLRWHRERYVKHSRHVRSLRAENMRLTEVNTALLKEIGTLRQDDPKFEPGVYGGLGLAAAIDMRLAEDAELVYGSKGKGMQDADEPVHKSSPDDFGFGS